MRLLRTMLYVPGNQPRMLAKAPDLGADALLLDLEDSVPMAEKDRARELVSKAVAEAAGRQGPPVFVRANAISTGLFAGDISSIAGPGLDGIGLPKVESDDQVREADQVLARAEAAHGLPSGSLALVVMIESALGLIGAHGIAAASVRVVAVAFGAEDYALDLGIARTDQSAELAFARQTVAVAARAAGVQAVDMVYPRIDDEAGLTANTEGGRQMGYRCKQVIHPRQVPVVNRLLTPSPEELAEALAVVATAMEAEKSGRGAIALGGRMIDRPVMERARRLLELGSRLSFTR